MNETLVAIKDSELSAVRGGWGNGWGGGEGGGWGGGEGCCEGGGWGGGEGGGGWGGGCDFDFGCFHRRRRHRCCDFDDCCDDF